MKILLNQKPTIEIREGPSLPYALAMAAMFVVAGGALLYMGYDFYGVLRARDEALDSLELRRTKVAALEKRCTASIPKQSTLDATLDCLHHLALERRLASERSTSGLLRVLENTVDGDCHLSNIDWMVDPETGTARLDLSGDARDVSSVVDLVRSLSKRPPFEGGAIRYYSPSAKGVSFRARFSAPPIIEKKRPGRGARR